MPFSTILVKAATRFLLMCSVLFASTKNMILVSTDNTKCLLLCYSLPPALCKTLAKSLALSLQPWQHLLCPALSTMWSWLIINSSHSLKGLKWQSALIGLKICSPKQTLVWNYTGIIPVLKKSRKNISSQACYCLLHRCSPISSLCSIK